MAKYGSLTFQYTFYQFVVKTVGSLDEDAHLLLSDESAASVELHMVSVYFIEFLLYSISMGLLLQNY